MTEQRAKPPQDCWFVRDCPQIYGDIEVVLGADFKIYIPLMATDWDDAKRSRMKDHARLIAGAPETAAERDRLAKALVELFHTDELTRKDEYCSSGFVKVRNEVRALLDEARKP